MILDPTLLSEILIDGPLAQETADAVKSISLSGIRVTPTTVGLGEIIRYAIFLGKVRPYLFRLEGVRQEMQALISNMLITSQTARIGESDPTIMLEAYQLSFSSNLNYSLAHLAATSSKLRESALCSRTTIAILGECPALKVSILKDYGSDLAEISIRLE